MSYHAFFVVDVVVVLFCFVFFFMYFLNTTISDRSNIVAHTIILILLETLRQENCHKFKASLGYLVSSGQSGTQCETASKTKTEVVHSCRERERMRS